MLAEWPRQDDRFHFEADCLHMTQLMELVRAIRNIRAEMKVPPAQKIAARLIVPQDAGMAFEEMSGYLAKLAGVDQVAVTAEAGEIPKNDVHIVCEGVEAVIPLSSLIDPEKEKARLHKEIERVSSDIARAKGKLGNEGFIAKAPQAVVDEEKAKLSLAEDMLTKLRERLDSLC